MNYFYIIVTSLIISLMVIKYFNLFEKYMYEEVNKNIYILITALIVFNLIWGYILFTKFGFILYYFSIYLLINILLIIAIIDYKTKYIPDILILVLLALGMWTMFVIPDVSFYNPLLTSIILFLVLLIANKVSKDSIGMGDVKLIPVISLFLGFSNIFSVIFISLLLSLIFGVILIIKDKKDIKTEIPFVPFIFIGVLLNLLL